jgi:hypothetical protein
MKSVSREQFLKTARKLYDELIKFKGKSNARTKPKRIVRADAESSVRPATAKRHVQGRLHPRVY